MIGDDVVDARVLALDVESKEAMVSEDLNPYRSFLLSFWVLSISSFRLPHVWRVDCRLFCLSGL